MRAVIETVWESCYEDAWTGLIGEDAFARPAKFARGLIRRIYAHLLGSGRLRPGDTVADPFGGVALGALDAMMSGLHWRGCELEPRFVALGQANLDLWRTRWGHATTGTARLVQGDSRRLCEVLGAAECVVSSPPFQGSLADAADRPEVKTIRPNLPSPDEVSAYLRERRKALGLSCRQINESLGTRTLYSWYEGRPAGVQIPTPEHWQKLKALLGLDDRFDAGIMTTAVVEATGKNATDKTGHAKTDHYGTTPGQLGALPPGNVDAVVSSPPYEDCPILDAPRGNAGLASGGIGTQYRLGNRPKGAARKADGGTCEGYGDTEGQLGQESGDTFWAAAKTIVEQCYRILHPGGVAAFVCKDFVRRGQRVSFSADWLRLCQSCGFRLVEWIKASLVKRVEEPSLFGGVEVSETARKSFFRRLAESKGSPRIDEEDVLILEKPKEIES